VSKLKPCLHGDYRRNRLVASVAEPLKDIASVIKTNRSFRTTYRTPRENTDTLQCRHSVSYSRSRVGFRYVSEVKSIEIQ